MVAQLPVPRLLEEEEGGGHSNLAEVDPSGGAVFLVVGLLLGVLFRRLQKKLHLPYTVILLLLGAIVGAIEVNVHLGAFGDSITSWVNLDPHRILLIFLPSLIFGSAYAVDYHVFSYEFWQMVCLAGPGVVLSTVLSSLVPMYMFDYNWDWYTGLTFGAMLSATDPVAVVALLRELGAPLSLSLLIEGESLLNDGTAMVVFLVFKDFMTGHTRTVGETIGFFCRLSFGGAALGILMGYFTYKMLARMQFDTVAQITTTIVAAYGSFIIAEGTPAHLSGVLAVVGLGLFLASTSRTVVHEHHTMHSFWEMIEYLANTLIFLLAGLVIYERGLSKDSIRGVDWAYLFLLFLMLNIIRFTVNFLLLPLLKRCGYGMSWKEFFVLSWAGLRGAVGLTLALFMEDSVGVDSRDKDLFVFHMAGVAALTLLVNGTTTGFFVRKLGLAKSSEASDLMFMKAVDHVNHHIHEATENLKHDAFYQDSDWKQVQVEMEKLRRHLRGRVKGTLLKKQAGKQARKALGAAMQAAVKVVEGPSIHVLKGVDFAAAPRTTEGGKKRRASKGKDLKVGGPGASSPDPMKDVRPPPLVTTTDTTSPSESESKISASEQSSTPLVVMTKKPRGIETANADVVCADEACLEPPIITAAGEGEAIEKKMERLTVSVPKSMRTASDFPSFDSEEIISGAESSTASRAPISTSFDGLGEAKAAFSGIRAPRSQTTDLLPRSRSRTRDITRREKAIMKALVDTRRRFLNLVKAQYWEQFETGMVGPSAVRLLVESASWAQDFPKNELREWQFLKRYTGRRWYYKFILMLCGKCRGDRLLYKPLGFEYDLATTFIDAHTRAKALLQALAPPKAFQRVAKEVENMVVQARNRVDEISTTFPEVTRSIKTFHVVHALAKEARNVAKHLLHDGEIEEKEFEIIDEAAVNLSSEAGRPKVSVDDKAVLRDVSYFKTLDDITFERMFAVSEKKLHKPGDIILAQGVKAHGVYIVIRGSVTRYRTRPENEKERNVADRFFSQAPESNLFNVHDDKVSLQKRLDTTRAADAAMKPKTSFCFDELDDHIHATTEDSSDGIIRVNRHHSESSVGLPHGFVERSSLGSSARVGANSHHPLHNGAVPPSSETSKHLVHDQISPGAVGSHHGGSGGFTTDSTHHDHPQSARSCKERMLGCYRRMAHPFSWLWRVFRAQKEMHAPYNPKVLPPESYFVDHIGPGGVIGVLSMFTGKRQGVTARCDSNVVTVYLDQSKMFELLKSAPHPRAPIRIVQPLEVILCRMAGVLVAEMHLSAFSELSPSQIRQMLGKATLVRPEPYRPTKIQGKAILLTGNLVEPVNWEKLASLCGGSLASAWGMSSPKVANPQLLRLQKSKHQLPRARGPKAKEHRRSRLSHVRTFDIQPSPEQKVVATETAKTHKKQQASRAALAEEKEREQQDSGYEEDTEASASDDDETAETGPNPSVDVLAPTPVPDGARPPLPSQSKRRRRRRKAGKSTLGLHTVDSTSSLGLSDEPAKVESTRKPSALSSAHMSSDELIEIGDRKPGMPPGVSSPPPASPPLQRLNTEGRIAAAKNLAEDILAAPVVDVDAANASRRLEPEVKRHETPVNRLRGLFRKKDAAQHKHGFDPDYHARLKSTTTVLSVNNQKVILSAEDFRPISYGFFFLDSEPNTTRWFSPNTRLLVIPVHFASMFNNARQRVMESIQLHRHLRKVSNTFQKSRRKKETPRAPPRGGTGLLGSSSAEAPQASLGMPPAPPSFDRRFTVQPRHIGAGLGIRDTPTQPPKLGHHATAAGLGRHAHGHGGGEKAHPPAHPPLVRWKTIVDPEQFQKHLNPQHQGIRREGSFGNLHEAEDSLDKLSTTHRRKSEMAKRHSRRRNRRHTIMVTEGVGSQFDTTHLRSPDDIKVHTLEELTASGSETPRAREGIAHTRSMSARALHVLEATKSTITPTAENPHPNLEKHMSRFDSRLYANRLHHGKKMGNALAPKIRAISAARYYQCRTRRRLKAEAEAWLHHACVDDLQRGYHSGEEQSKRRRHKRRRRRRMSSFDEGSRHATDLALHEFGGLEVSGFCSDTDCLADLAASKIAIARKAKEEAVGLAPFIGNGGGGGGRHLARNGTSHSSDTEERRSMTPLSEGFDSVESMDNLHLPRAPPISLSRPRRSPLLSSTNRRLHGNQGLHTYSPGDPESQVRWNEPTDIGLDLDDTPNYTMSDLVLGPSASSPETKR